MKSIDNVGISSVVKITKVCIKCGVEKELSEYGKDKRHKDGRTSQCKECYNRKRRENYQRPEVKERKKEYSDRPEIKERRRKNQQKPGVKEKRKEREIKYDQRPGVKEKRKEREKEWRQRPEVKKHKEEYKQRPEVKQRYKEWEKEYCQRPGVKKRIRERRIKYENNRYKTDTAYRIGKVISSGLCRTLKTKNLSKSNRHWEDLVGYIIQEFMDYITPLFCKKIVNGKEIIMSWDNHGTEWEIDHIYPTSLCGNTEADVIYNWRLENLQPLWKEDNLEKKDRLDWVRDPNKYIRKEHK